MNPDYGSVLARQSAGADVIHCFYGVSVDHITLLGPEAGFTTLVNIVIDSEVYAASFDFGMDNWEAFLDALSEDEFDALGAALPNATCLPHTFEFVAPQRFDLAVRLGNPQRGVHDTFVPLVVERVVAP